jgi:hypothetical protein
VAKHMRHRHFIDVSANWFTLKCVASKLVALSSVVIIVNSVFFPILIWRYFSVVNPDLCSVNAGLVIVSRKLPSYFVAWRAEGNTLQAHFGRTGRLSCHTLICTYVHMTSSIVGKVRAVDCRFNQMEMNL